MSKHAAGFDTRLKSKKIDLLIQEKAFQQWFNNKSRQRKYFLRSFFGNHVMVEAQLYRGESKFHRKEWMTLHDMNNRNKDERVKFYHRLSDHPDTRLWTWKDVNAKETLVRRDDYVMWARECPVVIKEEFYQKCKKWLEEHGLKTNLEDFESAQELAKNA